MELSVNFQAQIKHIGQQQQRKTGVSQYTQYWNGGGGGVPSEELWYLERHKKTGLTC